MGVFPYPGAAQRVASVTLSEETEPSRSVTVLQIWNRPEV